MATTTFPALGLEMRNSDDGGKCFRVIIAGEVLVTQRVLRTELDSGDTGQVRRTAFTSPAEATTKARSIVANRAGLDYVVAKAPTRFDIDPNQALDESGIPLITAYVDARNG